MISLVLNLPRVRARVEYVVLSLKSGSVATQVIWGISKNEDSSEALLQAENTTKICDNVFPNMDNETLRYLYTFTH